MPITPNDTVWFPETAWLAVAVTVMAVVPASVPEFELTERFTVGFGAASSFVIVP